MKIAALTAFLVGAALLAIRTVADPVRTDPEAFFLLALGLHLFFDDEEGLT